MNQVVAEDEKSFSVLKGWMWFPMLRFSFGGSSLLGQLLGDLLIVGIVDNL